MFLRPEEQGGSHFQIISFNRSLFRNSEPELRSSPPISPGLRAFDKHCADRFRIERRRAHAPDDGVAVALLPHVLEAGEQQARASVFSHLNSTPVGPKKLRNVASWQANPTTLPSLTAMKQEMGWAAKGDLGLAGPALGEILP